MYSLPDLTSAGVAVFPSAPYISHGSSEAKKPALQARDCAVDEPPWGEFVSEVSHRVHFHYCAIVLTPGCLN